MMERVVLDEPLASKLSALEEAELCDRSGRCVGYFLAESRFYRLLFDWANAQITDGELQRRLRQPGARTLDEIWARLGRAR